MKTSKLILSICLAILTLSMQAQIITIDIKVTDVDGETTLLTDASSSAATGCASPDFPAMLHGVKEQFQMEDFKYITVMSYEPSSNEALYITAELEKPDGTKIMVELSKYLRFSGSGADGERASFTVKDISMIEVIVTGN